MKKIALGIEYNGADYCGWQRQLHSPSVQQCLEEVLAKVADHNVQLYCAGRTDTGVHATGQVAHFELSSERPLRAWTMGANTQLPSSIAIRWATEVTDGFHARFSATARRYRYIIANTATRPAIAEQNLTWCRKQLDVSLMKKSCKYFLGEQNFTSFQASSCQSSTPMRNVHHLFIEKVGDYIIIDIKANAFLHHMVRNIAGTLMDIGKSIYPPEWAGELLASQDRTKASTTASPKGLYIVDVDYPESYKLPQFALGPLFLG